MEEVFPVIFEIKTVAVLLVVLEANIIVPKLFAPSLSVSPISNVPLAAIRVNLLAGLIFVETSVSLKYT